MAKNNIKNDAITPRDVDFAQWYTDVCRKAELMDYSSVNYLSPIWLCFMGTDSELLG